MEIRKLKLPQDIDDLARVSIESFQYPENPEWSIAGEEAVELRDQINGIKRFWPLLRLAMLFSPTMRYLFMGFVCEEEGRMIGTVMYQRRAGDGGEYYINNVGVDPTQRRRGIARRLVETALEDIRTRGGRKVLLDVIDGNLPAYRLYEQMGWEHFSGSVHLVYDPAHEVGSAGSVQPGVGNGYEVVDLPFSDWRTPYQLAAQITPGSVGRYAPVEESRYRESLALRLLEPLTGVRRAQAVLRTAGGQAVGFCSYRYRTRTGGTNHAHLVADPVHSQAVPGFLAWLHRRLEQLAPGRKLELITPAWQGDVIAAARSLGYSVRLEYHTMGLLLAEH